MALFADDKNTLWQWRDALIKRLAQLRLTIHEEVAEPRPTDHGLPFLGFVIYPTHRLLKRRKGINYRRRLRDMMADYRRNAARRYPIDRSVRGWVNHVRYGDTWGLRRVTLKEVRL